MLFRDEHAADLYEEFQELEYREQDMLSLHQGCLKYFATRDKDSPPFEARSKSKMNLMATNYLHLFPKDISANDHQTQFFYSRKNTVLILSKC